MAFQPPPDDRIHNTAPGYITCSHVPCYKKANPAIEDHDCCGRCRTSKARGCFQHAHDIYDGPGTFSHPYHDTLMKPGVCMTCGEPLGAHRR